MECKGVQEKLSAYVEGDVSSDEKRHIEQHLNSCQKCRTALEDLKNAGELVRGIEDVEPPAWLTEKIMSRVRAEEGREKGIFRKLFYPLHVKVPIEALATVLIAVVAVYVFRAAEPEMKRAQLSLPTGTVTSEEEAPRPHWEPRTELQAPGGKEAFKAEQKKDAGLTGSVPPAQSSLSRPTEEPTAVQKKESSLKSHEEGRKVADALKKQELAELKQAPQSATSEEGKINLANRAEVTRERRGLAAAPMSKGSAVMKSGPAIVTISAKDIRAAGEEVEKLLGQVGAWKIEKESLEGKEVLTAELKGQKRKELLEKLKAIGEIKEKGKTLDMPEGDISLRIEIVGNP